MKNFTKLLLILTVLLALPLTLLAAPVGKITHIEGNVDITVDEKARTANIGDAVNSGEILRAKNKSRAEITFADGNILRLAENTRVRITDYQMGEGKTSTMDLFRGKTQSIVSGLAKNGRYEVHTPTAVCGVRGTNFIAFFQNGVSGFVPKEGTIYGYNRSMPQDVKTVTPGQAIMVTAPNKPATIQPATSTEVEKHVSDTAPAEKKEGEEKKDEGKKDNGKKEGETVTPPPPPANPGEGDTLKDRVEKVKEIDTSGRTITDGKKTEEARNDSGPSTTKTSMQAEVSFGLPGETTATGTLAGELDNATNTGSIAAALQYTETSPGSGVYNTPRSEIGLTSGTMSDGSAFDSYLSSVPGSWMGATGGIYRKGTGAGLFLGYLSGTYDAAKGLLTASGAATRTSPILTLTGTEEVMYSSEDIAFAGLSSIGIGENGAVFMTPGESTLKANNAMVLYNKAETEMVAAWALDNLNGDGSVGYENLSGQTTWKAKYGGEAPSGLGSSDLNYFLVGDVTGTESDPSRVRLSGRGLLFINPYEMGYVDFEYWLNAGGYAGGAGILQAKPLAFGGYWGYDMACLYANDLGEMTHVGDEWGLIGSWSAPWTVSAAIKGAGAYLMDDAGDDAYPGLLWNSPISSRGYADWVYDFTDGDFYGFTAGRIGKFAKAADGIWQRSAKGALAALYAKGGKAGILTSFSAGSAVGGLTGGFYPSAARDGGFWSMDGTLTATPLATVATSDEYSLDDTSFDAVAGYAAGASFIKGSGNGENLHFSVYDPQRESSYILPWGVYLLEMNGSSDYGGNTFASASGNSADLSGKSIKIGGTSSSGIKTYWLGDLKDTLWSGADNGVGEITGVFSGSYLSEDQMGTFGGPFSGLYNEGSVGMGYGTWVGQGVGTRSGALLAFSSRLDGHISKVVRGSLKGAEYTALYRLPSGAEGYGDFSAGADRYAKVRYQGIYFDDGVGVNRGIRFEEFRDVQTTAGNGAMQIRKDEETWYAPDGYYTQWAKGPIVNWGKTSDTFPSLDLSNTAVTGGAAGNHPHFPGTLGSASSFPADYNPETFPAGTFVPTYTFTYANANSGEQIGSFSGILGARGEAMSLWTASTAAAPVSLAFLGLYTHDEGYTGAAYQGTLGFGSGIGAYVDAGNGYGGAYFGFLAGLLPGKGSPNSMEGNLYSLYVSKTAQGGNKAGIIMGALSPGEAYPEIGMWRADGTMYRTGLEVANSTDVTPAALIDSSTQQPTANVVMGRAGVEGTAGFYNPAGARALTLGSGHGWSASIRGINDFGVFTLRHDFMNRYENASTATTWETAGWAEFGQYDAYRDLGYWYASLSDKSWGNNRLAGTLNGEFLTLKKWGLMRGQLLGAYDNSGLWGAGSQGYWLKSRDLAFSSQIGGTQYQLQHELYGNFFGSGATYYNYWLSDPSQTDRYGSSTYTSGSTTTIQQFDRQGPENTYYRETWATDDGGTTWSYAKTDYSDKTSYLAALEALSTQPAGSWESNQGDSYHLWENDFNGIMGGLNERLWTEGTSGLKFRGNYSIMDDPRITPSLSAGEIASIDPETSLEPYVNSTTPIGGAYRGWLRFAVNTANVVKGDLIALYQDNFLGSSGGYAGILYAADISGANHPGVGSWEAEGTMTAYEMTTEPILRDPATFAQSIVTRRSFDSYASGGVPVDVISGGTVDTRISQMNTQHIPDQQWGIWQMVAGGSITGDAPGSWVARQDYGPLTGGLGYGTNVLNFKMEAPSSGISTGTVAGAQVLYDDPTPAGPKSHVVVLGGNVKGLFDPSSTSANWMAIAQGGAMDAKAFMDRQSAMGDDAARANFERAMKIPTFDVGTANLRGNDGLTTPNLYVNMDGIKFFRFQTEANPRIWATGNVYGSYTSNPSLNTKVQLNSSSDLSGLKHTFEVKQWDTTNNNWGATVYRSTATGSTDTGGTLIRNEPSGRTLPTGASNGQGITINEMRGGAAGVIRPGVAGANGPNSFVGTGAGTVR
jgi:hypothetical protein